MMRRSPAVDFTCNEHGKIQKKNTKRKEKACMTDCSFKVGPTLSFYSPTTLG